MKNTLENRKIKFQQKLNKKYPQESLEVIEFTYMKSTPAKVKCLLCGNIIEMNADSFLCKEKNRVCEKCFPNKRDIFKRNLEKFKKESLKSNLFFDWNKIDIKKSSETIESTCNKCGKNIYKTIKNYNRSCFRCPYCECNNTLKTKEQLQNELPEDIIIIGKYFGANKKTLFKHECGFIWEATPHNILQGKGCPRCNRFHSKGEKRIEKFLKLNNIEYIKEFKITLENHNLRTDFFIPKMNLHIEFNGRQHYEPIDYFGGEKQFNHQVEMDNLKKKYLNIIEISYKDFEKIEDILTLMFNDYPKGVGLSKSKS